MSIELFDLSGFRGKQETTEGTFETLAAADAIRLLDGQGRIQGGKLERNIQRPNGGSKPFIGIERRMTVSGMIELVGPTTPGAVLPYSDFAKACGHIETLDTGPPAITSLQPTLQGIPSISMDFFHAGLRYRGAAGRGRFSSLAWAINDYAKAGIDVLAKVVGYAEEAIPSDSLVSFQVPTPLLEDSLTVNLDGTVVDCVSLELSDGRNVALSYGSETTRTFRQGREFSGNLTVWRDDNWADLITMVETNALVPLELLVDDTVDARKQKATFVEVQLDEPEPVNVDNRAAWRFPITIMPGPTGNADYVLEFGTST